MANAQLCSPSELLSALQQNKQKTDEQWRESLCERKLAELKFHDSWRDTSLKESTPSDTLEALQANTKYYSTVAASRRYTVDWIEKHAKDRVFLDYACGDGDNAIRAAQAGAQLSIGIDISPVSVDNASRRAEEAGVAANSYFTQADCENTGLPSCSVDAIICNGMLHHLDLSYAFSEMRRILKPGGVCLAVEALDYNPLIKLYRLLTPALRTEWEKHHILSLKDLKFAQRFFDVSEVRYWHLMSILATPIRKMSLFPTALSAANALDSILLKIPPISYMAWIFTFELHKRYEN